jgi:hypothetical protein
MACSESIIAFTPFLTKLAPEEEQLFAAVMDHNLARIGIDMF